MFEEKKNDIYRIYAGIEGGSKTAKDNNNFDTYRANQTNTKIYKKKTHVLKKQLTQALNDS